MEAVVETNYDIKKTSTNIGNNIKGSKANINTGKRAIRNTGNRINNMAGAFTTFEKTIMGYLNTLSRLQKPA